MNLKLVHDPETDVLRLLTVEHGTTSSSLWDTPNVVLDLGGEQETRPVALMLLASSVYLPLGGDCYDAALDLLSLGDTSPPFMTDNGDLLAYWENQEGESALVGAGLRNASMHLDSPRWR